MNQLVQNLEKKGYRVKVTANREEAREYILSQIPQDSLVGIGGSMTISEIGIYEALIGRGDKVLWHWKVDSALRRDVCREALLSDFFLTSTNALTEDGTLVNIDGNGNRVAAMIFGPKHVIMAVGKNKIVSDTHSAIKRVKAEACPKNAKRLGLKTPCGVTGVCTDCDSSKRMCNVMTILDNKPGGSDFEIVLINEDLGF